MADPFEHDRRRMIELHIASRGVERKDILAAFAAIPREAFVPAGRRGEAYADHPVPIGEGQTISQPYIVARMVEALELAGGDRALEIGAGSGYAAAIMGQIAAEVFAVERIGVLVDAATRVLSRLGIGNVHVHLGDGTMGLPAHAPYDAIAVAAGGPVVPQPLLDQLAVGGRLVMPVTDRSGEGQTLIRVRRVSEREFEQEELEPVRFVPLIGARGYTEGTDPDEIVLLRRRLAPPASTAGASKLVREVAMPFAGIDDARIESLVDRIGDARVVLLGESTHGTHEFYALRAKITRRLIERHGFDFVAAEADWPDAARIDAWVRARPAATAPAGWAPFTRFPTWMWRNTDVQAFVEWLREHNAGASERSVGFHGLDMYSMYASIGFVLRYLEEVDPDRLATARASYARLLPWKDKPERYGMSVVTGRLDSAADSVVSTLRDILARRLEYIARDGDRFFDAAQNARVVATAERYYRSMFFGRAESWNLRDSHMFETLRLLLASYGPGSRGVVWAHNSHCGDARATEMRDRGELNIGQLSRQAFGDDARIVGFSTDHGYVYAADDWGEDGQVKVVRDGHPESYEHVFHATRIPAFVLSMQSRAREELEPARLMRAIGVVYAPETELESHYFASTITDQLDELVWIDETQAVSPVGPRPPAHVVSGDLPETFPFAL